MKFDLQIKVTPDQWMTAIMFAEQSFESRQAQLKRRRQHNKNKIIQDIAAGTVAEMAISQWLGEVCSEPDLTIYTAKHKSFGADLTLKDRDIYLHVKTFTPRERLPDSWVFQAAPWDTDPLVTSAYHGHFLVLTSTTKEHVKLHWVVHQPDIHRLRLWRDPVVPRLRGIKRVLYSSDLEQLAAYYVDNEPHEWLGEIICHRG